MDVIMYDQWSLSLMRKAFNYLLHLGVGKLYKKKMYMYNFPSDEIGT